MRTLATLLVSALLLFGISLAGAAPAASATTHHAARSCNLNNDHWKAQWGAKNLGTIDYVWGEWTANPCGQKLEVRGLCHNTVVGSNYNVYSGQVKAVNLKAEADCGLDDELLVADIRLTNADGTWRPWGNLCGPCGTRKTTG